ARRPLAHATGAAAAAYACHKTRGFENMRKPGPILTRIDSKLQPDWVKNWIRNPRAVKPTTWMPRFFYNSNNGGADDPDKAAGAVRNEAEINGIGPALFAHGAKDYQPAAKNPAHGDPQKGEPILQGDGCQGRRRRGERA